MMIKHALLVLSVCVSQAFSEPSEEALDAAEELADAMGLIEQMNSGFDAMLPMVEDQAQQFGLNEEETKEFTDIYRKWFTDDCDFPGLADEVTKLYAEAFTVEELEGLTAFYRTPLGKKALMEMPELMKKGAELGMIEGQKNQGKLMARIETFLEQREEAAPEE